LLIFSFSRKLKIYTFSLNVWAQSKWSVTVLTRYSDGSTGDPGVGLMAGTTLLADAALLEAHGLEL
jgi:hypothetical protein